MGRFRGGPSSPAHKSAATAYMGEGTVRNHISSILAKMGLRNRTQIAIAYLRG